MMGQGGGCGGGDPSGPCVTWEAAVAVRATWVAVAADGRRRDGRRRRWQPGWQPGAWVAVAWAGRAWVAATAACPA